MSTPPVAKLTNTANYQWDDGTTEDKTIVWSIGEKTPAVSDFAVTYPRSEDLVYNGNAKKVTAKLSDSYPVQDITLTVVCTNADGIAVEEPTNAGTYTVKLCVSGSSNFAAAELALADLTIVPMGQELSFAEARVELTYDPASTSYTQTVSGAKGPVVYRGSDDTVARWMPPPARSPSARPVPWSSPRNRTAATITMRNPPPPIRWSFRRRRRMHLPVWRALRPPPSAAPTVPSPA